MANAERIPLLDTRLELTRYLTGDELDELSGVTLPAVTLDPGGLDLCEVLSSHKAFGATVLDGVVMNSLRVGEQTGIQLLGPGDLLVPGSDLVPPWLAAFEARTGGSVQLGLFGNDLLAAAYRRPRIVQSLYALIGDQLQRLTAQLVICQLPRVDDRVLAVLWLLSETWGQVTPSGVRLPLPLTHETLGALIGAARPTVTLALRKLAEQGAIVHQDSGWLLLEPPPAPAEMVPHILVPEAGEDTPRLWAQAPAPDEDRSAAYAELRATVRRLRAEHQFERENTLEQLERVRNARMMIRAVRRRIQQDAVKRRSPPSS